MQMIQAAKTSILSEINQRKNLQRNLLLKALSSKRLLNDHIELVEDSLNDLLKGDGDSSNLLTFCTTSGVLASSYVLFAHFKQNLRYIIPVVSGVMPVLYARKLGNIKRRESLEMQLAKFITSLDNYEAAIKKNKTLLGKAKIFKSSEKVLKRYDKDNKIPQNLVQSIKTVINVLYEFVKDLEKTFAISEKANLMYEPFENLEDCELMSRTLEQEIDTKIIREFFNIFAYVQSQALLRFSLIVASNVDDCKFILQHEINYVIDKIRNETSNISKLWEIINSAVGPQPQSDYEIISLPKELREVRNGSVVMSSKILFSAMQYQYLEEALGKFTENFEHPDPDHITQILGLMSAVENDLSVSLDEHKRNAILFQKYLNIKTEVATESQATPSTSADGDKSENIKKVTEDDEMARSDEFFFVDGSNVEQVEEANAQQQPDSVDEVNTKLVKNYFKPVLVQLKERIEVIGDDMKKRERKVLKAKGIEMVNEPEPVKILNDSFSDDVVQLKERIEVIGDDMKKRERKVLKAKGIEMVNEPEPVKILNGSFSDDVVQLKERIEVIGDDRRKREKKVLKAKGIEMVNEPEPVKIPNGDDGDSGSDDDRERKRKSRKNEEKFRDSRQFLSSKQPISFDLPAITFEHRYTTDEAPPKRRSRPVLKEDVLE